MVWVGAGAAVAVCLAVGLGLVSANREFPQRDQELFEGLVALLATTATALQKLRPTRLISMEQFPNDALEAHLRHGDIARQFCSNTAETNIHALRAILRRTPDILALRWKLDGFLPPHTIKKLGKETVRNLLGFKDGTANLDASDEKLMNEIVRVQPSGDGPAWTSGGTLSGHPSDPDVRGALGPHRSVEQQRSSAARRRAALP